MQPAKQGVSVDLVHWVYSPPLTGNVQIEHNIFQQHLHQYLSFPLQPTLPLIFRFAASQLSSSSILHPRMLMLHRFHTAVTSLQPTIRQALLRSSTLLRLSAR
ncbi:hypothetical protein BLNAU_3160 [Blattamonas nauphoetae]|uniref:Uncharacterized protein n=1 Tax=Blattamonas nauphoetae TaxID=2049346 RepID=A0ABQ9YD86_9EUKA|nr:hypothetical protein BLNAU_3160 [Blattamonas nauphoetae]